LSDSSHQTIKPCCFGYYTDVDRAFRSCVGCKHLYECNPSEPREELLPDPIYGEMGYFDSSNETKTEEP
jgi:hypothetical protein